MVPESELREAAVVVPSSTHGANPPLTPILEGTTVGISNANTLGCILYNVMEWDLDNPNLGTFFSTLFSQAEIRVFDDLLEFTKYSYDDYHEMYGVPFCLEYVDQIINMKVILNLYQELWAQGDQPPDPTCICCSTFNHQWHQAKTQATKEFGKVLKGQMHCSQHSMNLVLQLRSTLTVWHSLDSLMMLAPLVKRPTSRYGNLLLMVSTNPATFIVMTRMKNLQQGGHPFILKWHLNLEGFLLCRYPLVLQQSLKLGGPQLLSMILCSRGGVFSQFPRCAVCFFRSTCSMLWQRSAPRWHGASKQDTISLLTATCRLWSKSMKESCDSDGNFIQGYVEWC